MPNRLGAIRLSQKGLNHKHTGGQPVIQSPDGTAGPTIPWKEGRSDMDGGNACGPDGRLPDASLDQKHLRDIFYRMVRDRRPVMPC